MLTKKGALTACCWVLALGCSRQTAATNDAGVDAGADGSPEMPVIAAPSTTTHPALLPDPEDATVPAAEALRKVIPKVEDDPQLVRQRDALTGFFKDELPSPFAAQFEALPGNRQAILVPGKLEAGRPFVMVIDANGTRAWTKDMPLAGIVPGVRDIALVRGAESAVGIAFCDATGNRAALRMWNADGSINADFEVMDIPHCEMISAMFVPGVGHLIGSTGETTARIGRIAANGMRVWDSAGIALPWNAMPKTALTLAGDSDNSFVVVGVDAAEKEKRRPNDGTIMAMRYDLLGRELWPTPVTLGHRRGRTLERVRVRHVGPGKLEIQVGDKPNDVVELNSDGTVTPLK